MNKPRKSAEPAKLGDPPAGRKTVTPENLPGQKIQDLTSEQSEIERLMTALAQPEINSADLAKTEHILSSNKGIMARADHILSSYAGSTEDFVEWAVQQTRFFFSDLGLDPSNPTDQHLTQVKDALLAGFKIGGEHRPSWYFAMEALRALECNAELSRKYIDIADELTCAEGEEMLRRRLSQSCRAQKPRKRSDAIRNAIILAMRNARRECSTLREFLDAHMDDQNADLSISLEKVKGVTRYSVNATGIDGEKRVSPKTLGDWWSKATPARKKATIPT